MLSVDKVWNNSPFGIIYRYPLVPVRISFNPTSGKSIVAKQKEAVQAFSPSGEKA
jgi:hypothetical protein